MKQVMLHWLSNTWHWPYVPATLVAVESAILHNFFWHERITWDDRRREAGSSAQRLLRFHLGTGLTSLLGNLAVTTFAVEALHFPTLLANAMAVGTTSLANFLVADRYVFSSTSATVIVAAIFLGPASSLA